MTRLLTKVPVPSHHSIVEIEDNDGHSLSTATASIAFGRSRAESAMRFELLYVVFDHCVLVVVEG